MPLTSPKPEVYLTVVYQHSNGEVAVVFSDMKGDCSYFTLRGCEVVQQGELGKADITALHNRTDMFTSWTAPKEDTN